MAVSIFSPMFAAHILGERWKALILSRGLAEYLELSIQIMLLAEIADHIMNRLGFFEGSTIMRYTVSSTVSR